MMILIREWVWDYQVNNRESLQPENRYLRKKEVHALKEAEKVVRVYDTALNGLQSLAGEAEVNYDEILRLDMRKKVSQHEMVASNERMKEC